MNKAVLLFLITSLGTMLYAQKEADNWYFGRNAGVSFQNGAPVGLADGRLNTLEGCSSISDRDGSLLFYTDGSTIWNADHDVMQNGQGLNGDFSSTSSGLIVPQPNNPGIYFVFTVDEPHHFNADNDPSTSDGDGVNDGLNYSIVDITEDGGLGAVISKNIPLITYDFSNPLAALLKCSEKITAVRGADCESFWLITHFVDTFYAFRVDETGVVVDPTAPIPSPVISQVGIEVPLTGYRRNALGYLKASPDGTKLGVCHFGVIDADGPPRFVDGDGAIALYDFDDATGIVSNEVLLKESGSPYGVEFSPEGRKLYATMGEGINGGGTNFLLQYDLEAADIRASEYIVNTSEIYSAGALQLGPDGRIYRALTQFLPDGGFANDDYLGVINNPEADGPMVDYNPLGVRIDIDGRRGSRIGLPPFIQSIFTNIDIIQNGESTTALPLCVGESYRLQYDFITGATYTWSIDGVVQPLPPDQNFFDLTNVTIGDGGSYELEVDLNNGDCPLEGLAVVTVYPLPPAIDSTLVQCDADPSNSMDGITAFNLDQAYDSITMNTPDLIVDFFEDPAALAADTPITDRTRFRNTTPFNQNIIVRVTDQIGCEDFADLELIVQPTLATLPITGPFFACDNSIEDAILQGDFDLQDIRDTFFAIFDTAEFYLSLEDALAEEDPLPDNYTTEDTTIFLRVENNNECQGIVAYELRVDRTPVVNIEDGIVCTNNPPLLVSAESGFDEYRWYRIEPSGAETQISTTQDANIFEAGQYRLELSYVYNSFGMQRVCSNSEEFTVLPSGIANFLSFEIEDISENNIVTILVDGDGDYEYAIFDDFGPYQDSNVFTNVPSGLIDFYVRDKNGCGTVGAFTAAVIGYPKFFTPNGDAQNDRWQIKGLTQFTRTGTRIMIFDRFGKLLKQLDPAGGGWDGLFNNRELPADDYWFSVELNDGRSFKGHFTLKR